MGSGFEVDLEQLRTHARNVEAVRDRLDAVLAASAHIAQDSQAYGLLCGWIAGVLEGRHSTQDELLAFAGNNLKLVAEQLRATADGYTGVDESNAGLVGSAGVGLGVAL